MYDIDMLAKVLVEQDLHFDLFGRETALLKGMFLVDELDSDDGFGRVDGDGFADARRGRQTWFLASQ